MARDNYCRSYFIEEEKKEPIEEIKIIPETTPIPTPTPVPTPTKTLIGNFEITFYCSCSRCSGGWRSATASGEVAKTNYTIAVDKDVIPLGSYVQIDDWGVYKAQDVGGAIKGNKIDVFIDNHTKCLELGRKKNIPVYMINK